MRKNNVHKLTILLCSAALTAGLLGGCGKKSTADLSVSKTNFYLDTVVTITLYGTDQSDAIDGCFSLLADYEALLSRTREGSDVWRINHSEGAPVTVSDETADLLKTALSYCERSGGAFDLTIAPLLSLWNFQPEKHKGTIPNSDQLTEALTHVDYRSLSLDGNTVSLSDPESSIDLGAIAKGYIADRLKDYLISEGCDSALLSLGGNILTIGTKPNGSPFHIGIRKPFDDTGALLQTVPSSGSSVVTSGTYERYFRRNGILYHHILDPKNGYPTDNGLTSVTILSEKSVDGDALSTACFVLGTEKGLELIESLDGIEAMFVTEDLKETYSSGWPRSQQ